MKVKDYLVVKCGDDYKAIEEVGDNTYSLLKSRGFDVRVVGAFKNGKDAIAYAIDLED